MKQPDPDDDELSLSECSVPDPTEATVNVTGMVCGELLAPEALMVIVAV